MNHWSEAAVLLRTLCAVPTVHGQIAHQIKKAFLITLYYYKDDHKTNKISVLKCPLIKHTLINVIN